MKLNLGCGHDYRKGWVNCDLKPGWTVDRAFDLRTPPYPFEAESADEIYLSHVLEHLEHWEVCIDECLRLLKPLGILEVRVPYGPVYVPYHVRFFNPHTLDAYFLQQRYEDCCQFDFDKPPFALVERSVMWVFPLGWHLEHYLKIKLLNGRRSRFPLGRRMEIRWRLMKRASGVC